MIRFGASGSVKSAATPRQTTALDWPCGAPARRVRSGALAALALLAAASLAACGGGEEAEAPPPENFAPLHFDYLTKLHLRAGSIDVEDHSIHLGPSDIAAQAPEPPAQALADMAHARLFAAGLTGHAEFSIDQASIIQAANGELDGQIIVHLEIFAPDGSRAGFAQARVAKTLPPGTPGSLRANLYGLTRQMLDAMNVELEYQIRHDLGPYLESDAVVPGAVTAAPLDTPAAPPAAPDGTVPPASAAPVPPPEGAVPPAPPAPSPPVADAPPASAPEPDAAPPQMSPPPGFLHLPTDPPPR